MDSASKKVLITGIDSFTGIHLSTYLVENGYDVHGTSLHDVSDKKHRCDVTKKEDIRTVLKVVQPNFVIHLSGISFTAHGNNEDFYRINTIGTTNILDSLIELNIKPLKIILASSATVYGNQGLEVLDESLCPKPASHYGASKYAMESLTSSYYDKLNIIISRPFNYTGIGQAEHFLIPKIVKHFKDKQKFIELGNLDVSREFNDIIFVCEAYKKLLESNCSSEVVNICSNRGIKLLDVIGIMNRLAGYKIEIKVNTSLIRKNEIKTLTGLPNKLFDIIGTLKQKEFEEVLENIYYNSQ